MSFSDIFSAADCDLQAAIVASMSSSNEVCQDYENHENLLKEKLAMKGLRVNEESGVRSDGNCLFDCFSIAQTGFPDTEGSYRQWIVNKIRADFHSDLNLGFERSGSMDFMSPVDEVRFLHLFFQINLPDLLAPSSPRMASLVMRGASVPLLTLLALASASPSRTTSTVFTDPSPFSTSPSATPMSVSIMI